MEPAPYELLATVIPGLTKMLVDIPCACPTFHKRGLITAIVHLNDALTHGYGEDRHVAWTRERIADWLEGLDIDLTFQLVDWSHVYPRPVVRPCP